MDALKGHPFAVSAYFERVVAISFAFPEQDLTSFLAPGLRLDTYNGLGFITLSLVWTTKMRPSVLPDFFGRSFFLAGYRLFVKYKNNAGKNLRGLQILRSETDSNFMVFSGNLMTRYNYKPIKLDVTSTEAGECIIARGDSLETGFDITIPKSVNPAPLPENSPFPDWHEARKYAGPMLYTFSHNSNDNTMVIVKGAREDWIPTPVEVDVLRVGIFESERFLKLPKPILANAFQVRDIEYSWSKGLIEKLPQ